MLSESTSGTTLGKNSISSVKRNAYYSENSCKYASKVQNGCQVYFAFILWPSLNSHYVVTMIHVI